MIGVEYQKFPIHKQEEILRYLINHICVFNPSGIKGRKSENIHFHFEEIHPSVKTEKSLSQIVRINILLTLNLYISGKPVYNPKRLKLETKL